MSWEACWTVNAAMVVKRIMNSIPSFATRKLIRACRGRSGGLCVTVAIMWGMTHRQQVSQTSSCYLLASIRSRLADTPPCACQFGLSLTVHDVFWRKAACLHCYTSAASEFTLAILPTNLSGYVM